MRILCLETATDLGSVAVVVDGAVRAERTTPLHARLGDTLLGAVEDALAEAGVAKTSLELVAVGVGPGSFTGLRVGLSMAKGLYVGLGAPLVGVSTPRTLARAVRDGTSVVAIDARKDEAFIACFRHDGRGGLEPSLTGVHGSPEDMGRLARETLRSAAPTVLGTGVNEAFLAGLGAPFVRADLSLDRPSAARMVEDAVERFRAQGPDDPRTLVPDYVRGADITMPKP